MLFFWKRRKQPDVGGRVPDAVEPVVERDGGEKAQHEAREACPPGQHEGQSGADEEKYRRIGRGRGYARI